MDCMPQLHIASIHAQAQYNNSTPGIGVLCELSDNKRIAAGTYYNSYYRQSVYAAVAWQPLRFGPLRAGPLAGMATGYKFDAAAPLPILALTLSLPISKAELHLIVLPDVSDASPAAAALSISFRM